MYTLQAVMDRLNQALNYGAISYEDVSLYFDQAISELNTSLHTSIRTVSEILTLERPTKYNSENTVTLSDVSTDSKLAIVATTEEIALSGMLPYIYNTTSGKYGILSLTNGQYTYKYFDEIYAIYKPATVDQKIYISVSISNSLSFFTVYSYDAVKDFDMLEILTSDWINLYLIPYVCFKYVVREGDSGGLFAEEFSQGFQQLQNAYNVPYEVTISSVAGKPAYYQDVRENLNNLTVNVKTRAIYESMKHARAVSAADSKLSWLDDDFGNGIERW